MPKESVTTPPFMKLAEEQVDKFISSTYGECDPTTYRQAMIEWHRLAIENSFVAGQEFANDFR